MLFRRNNINIGIGLGILVPVVAFVFIFGLVSLFSLNMKTRTLALVAVCLNMLVVTNFRKNRAGESIRGTVIATVVMALGWFAWFYQEIMAEW
jgi:hypothetical protein